jgi:hypothetical protein
MTPIYARSILRSARVDAQEDASIFSCNFNVTQGSLQKDARTCLL